MKVLKFPFIFFLFMFASVKSTGANNMAGNEVSFESTTTYKLLKMDTVFYGNNSIEIDSYKKMFNKAIERIKGKFSYHEIKNADSLVAVSILKIIDSTLTEENFLFKTGQKRNFDFLTGAMREQFSFESAGLRQNEYREKYWLNRKEKLCRFIDCDLYCEIYIGIGQMAGLPLKMVEIPSHNYIRWLFADGGYIVWNGNDGKVYAENKMECYYKLTDSNRSHYLFNFQENNILGYYLFLIGMNFHFRNPVDLNRAKEFYELSIELDGDRPSTLNNYVWLHIMSPELDDSFKDKKMMVYIDKAISLEKNLNFYDAKACLYALQGNFAEALKVQSDGLKLLHDPFFKRKKAENHFKCFLKNEVCREIP
ncbi:hypothetical protein [Flavobacterium sp. LHD-85]|uniref:tetratricopeptide repeat protein n=1 Tax=Flavobacterium sp. LHD-85 TaxID=3071410 RepID=UPI0027E213D1|nr:hypothetical protein [Flavobacterium sp. LHD-85]MDQ6531033.1 hypothetical protein [Flavobacterium sp. LHD-85]